MTDNKHNIFISWSGVRSKHAAVALRDWLPLVLQSAKPWMSEEDIDKGSRGLDEVGRALEGSRIGIVCLTPENLAAPWILFESGALSKTLDTRVCTYLLDGLQPQDVERPLGMFQATTASKEDTKRLAHTVNMALEGAPVPDDNLDAVFEGMWPRLDEKLAKMPKIRDSAPAKRPLDEMVAEILDLSRSAAAIQGKAVEHIEDRLVRLNSKIDLGLRPMGTLRELADLIPGRGGLPSVKSSDTGDVARHCSGEQLRELRNRLGITTREIEEFSRAIADDRHNEEFYISNAWLTQVENRNSIPSIFKLYSLSVIYRTKFADLLLLFGVDLSPDEK